MLARLDDTSSHEDCIFRPLSRVHSLLPRPACAFGSFRFLLKSIDFIESPFESLRGQASFRTREGNHAGCLPASNILPPPFAIASPCFVLQSINFFSNPWAARLPRETTLVAACLWWPSFPPHEGDGHFGCSPASCVLLPSPESFLFPRI